MRIVLRIFGILLLLGGIIGTAFFSYFAFVEGYRTKPGLEKSHEEQVKKFALDRQKNSDLIKANANSNLKEHYALEENYSNLEKIERGEKDERLFYEKSVRFYERQALYALGSGIILVVGLVIFILSFIGRGKKVETV